VVGKADSCGCCSFANPGDGMQAGRGGLVGGAHHVMVVITVQHSNKGRAAARGELCCTWV
jgi:hypothetical protein